MDFLPSAFQGFAAYKQFVVYKLTPRPDNSGKKDKIPVNPATGQRLEWSKPESLMTSDKAIEAAKTCGDSHGVGFVFTETDPFWFLDIDNCYDTATNQWSPIALELISTFPGAAVEVSSSGRGLHLFGTGTPPPHSNKYQPLGLEFYTQKRFVALTGVHASGDVTTQHNAALAALVGQYFNGQKTLNTENRLSGDIIQQWNQAQREGARPEWNGNADDNELLKRMLNSRSAAQAFGNTAAFVDLWERNIDALTIAFSDLSHPSGFNESAADAALAQHLCFWTGNDAARIERFMRQSGLMRDKYDREDYLPRTILTERGRCGRWLQDKPMESPQTLNNPSATRKSTRVHGSTFLTADQQETFFAGCVYVLDENKILIPGGYLLDEARFKVMFGGYSFVMDAENAKVSRNAFEAFTQTQLLRHERVSRSAFLPKLPPGAITKFDGEDVVNTFWPALINRVKGDPMPFFIHLNKLFPDYRDQMIVLCYMAACVQFPGVKFQWCPFIQGVEGNGKTLLTRCVAAAIGRRYCYFPAADKITNPFNSWQEGKIFIGVEDVHVPQERREVIEILKPMITNPVLEIEGKGKDRIIKPICCNYILNSNLPDGLRTVRDNRRFAVFYTPQQCVEDLKRDGMDDAYFAKLYHWLNYQNGYEIVADLLYTFPIPVEYGLSSLEARAPITTSTESALILSRGRIEHEIIEAVEQSLPGFKGGWVSSIMLDRFLKDNRASHMLPINRRRDVMKMLGFNYHPGLKDGRVNNPVMPDGGKPRLYIQDGHAALRLDGNTAISKAYEDAQKA